MKQNLQTLIFRFLLIGCCTILLTTPAFAQTSSDDDTKIPVQKVVLFSSGVGFFEHAGEVSGDAQTTLFFLQNQMDDVLKSMVLQDLSGGKVTSIEYPSKDPVNRTLGNLSIDLSAAPALIDILKQLRGEDISVQLSDETLQGTILSLEERLTRISATETGKVWMLSVISAGQIRSVPMFDVISVTFTDNDLQSEMTKALTALVEDRDQDKAPVSIHFSGNGDRNIRLGYVVETPIWKTSYRLVLPADGKEKAFLQGWAIVENQTESDWENVSLSLISGRPISFVQHLYDPIYATRPVMEMEQYAGLTSERYDDGVGYAVASSVASAPKRSRVAGGFLAAEAEADMAYSAPAPMDLTASISAVANGERVGELFAFQIPNVTLGRHRSAMLPIVTDEIPVEKVSIYSASTNANHPLNGVSMTNSSGKLLLQGPITIFDDGNYAGDASLGDVPAGEERLLSYALDLEMHISKDQGSTNVLETAVIENGLLILSRKVTMTQTYTIENKSDHTKTVIINHPKSGGYDFIGSARPYETTGSMGRFKVEVRAGQKQVLAVKESRPLTERIVLFDSNGSRIRSYMSNQELPSKIRKALQDAHALYLAVQRTRNQISTLNQELTGYSTEQTRIRENMRSVQQDSDYYKRLLAKLDEQETQIEELQGRIEILRETLAGQEKSFEDYVKAMDAN